MRLLPLGSSRHGKKRKGHLQRCLKDTITKARCGAWGKLTHHQKSTRETSGELLELFIIWKSSLMSGMTTDGHGGLEETLSRRIPEVEGVNWHKVQALL